MRPDVAVVGSLHLDIVVTAPRLPHLDETLPGGTWDQRPGGKGLNQAAAAARAGARVAMGGRIGADAFGERLRAHLAAHAVDLSCLETDPETASGMSVAILVAGGEYGAVVVSGANARIPADGLARRWASLWRAPVLLLQNEVPEGVNRAAARAARAAGARVLLNAAPARTLPPDLLADTDVLILNRLEAAQIAPQGAAALRTPTRAVIVTRGAEGLVLHDTDGRDHAIPARPVTVHSAHGAGDAFCGTLAACLAAGQGLAPACAAAADAAGRFVAGEG
ncbi:PfkB family carbohydrate kinase [Rubellimicrobium sp. CFH 75288]|uniref:PfkB family carbohydrate kinase n=1 Tax=Rubellimicrobium sp. CFH 75288 TaxID=2697034 RepID=UPI001411ED4B|nr:PfkB family carbohydrate kinase [Rubellimicrobium sp. CFH 75288]NAZ35452.1 ribokinase [Rubellimicrobium sp. CFH 75288]